MLDSWIKFIKGHERLLLLAIVAGAGWLGWHEWVAFRTHELELNTQVKQQELANAKQAASDAATAAGKNQATTSRVDATALATIKELQARIDQMSKELATQQLKDASLDDTGLANRWATLLSLGTNDLLPQAGGGLGVTHPAAVKTVSQLEEVPVLQGQLTSIKGELAQKDAQIDARNTQINGLNDLVAANGLVIQKGDAACKAEVALAVQQEKNKRSKANWLIRGLIFVGGVIAGRKL